MRKLSTVVLFAILSTALSAQNVGIGETTPASKLSVKGGLSVGNGYSTIAAPTDGAIIKGQVGIGTASPNSSAVLDVTSTTQGVLYPRLNTTQRNAIPSPPQGLTIFNTSTSCLEFYVGTAWQTIACGCTSAPPTPGAISATSFTGLCATPTSYTFSINDVVHATSYLWSVPGDASAVITGQGGTSVTIAFSLNSGATGVSVQAVNSCGSSSASTTAVSFQTVPSASGGSITGLPLVVCPSAVSSVTLTAPAYSPAASSYTWSLPTGVVASGSTSGSSVTVTESATPGNSYVVSVTGNNCAGSSTTTTGTITVIGPPTAPTGLSANSIGTSFTASWTASTSSGTVAGYYLDVSTSSTFATFLTGYNNLNVGNVTSYNVTGLTCGTAYYFRVRAYDACSPAQTSASSATYTVSATPHGKQIFSYTGATQTFTVPCGVTSIAIKMWGGGGGGYFGSGGGAGYVSGNYTTSGGTALTILVGGGGSGNTSGTATLTYGGGGKGVGDLNFAEPSGSGGGYSSILNGATTIAIAGAGGGGGSYTDGTHNPAGGAGGGTTASNGTVGSSATTAYGKAGTAAAGGAIGTAGTGATAATAGASLTGGNGGGTYSATNSALADVFGGGGGGGYYGGGGGGGSKTTVTNCGGGGGGSSYTGGVTSGAVNTRATATSQISFNPPPNSTDADYLTVTYTVNTLFGTTTTGPGTGGDYSPTDGGAGLVVITW